MADMDVDMEIDFDVDPEVAQLKAAAEAFQVVSPSQRTETGEADSPTAHFCTRDRDHERRGRGG